MPHLFYPPKSILRAIRGLLLSPEYLINVDPQHMTRSANTYFVRTQLRRRRGFTRFSTQDWSAAVFRGGHEFLDDYGNARLLVGRDGGTIEEIQSAAAHTTVVAALTAGQNNIMATGFGATFVANGADALQRIDAVANPATACTSRRAGIPAPVANFTAVAGAAGGRTGDYDFMATAVIEIGGVKALESDWSDQVEVTLAAKAVTFGWTNPAIADSRVTHVYLYGTTAGGAEPYYITKVAMAATGLVNNNTLDAALGALANRRGNRSAPPTAPTHVEISGTRLVLIKGKTVYFSRPAINSYDLEAIQAQVDLQLPGAFKAAKTIAGDGAAINTNSYWVATDRACCIFFGTDPTTAQTQLSGEIGCIGPKAVTSRGNSLYWVDRRRGVMYWPGTGKTIYCVSEKITPVFKGGGNQNLTANQGDENITLEVVFDMLCLTVRDDTSKTGANKVYYMDLVAFERSLATMGPESAAVWGGAWDGPGFHRLLPRADGSLIVLDNQSKTILQWDTTTFSDYIGGAAVIAKPIVRFGPAMQEFLEEKKRLHHFYAFIRHGVPSKLRVIGQDGEFDYPGINLVPAGYPDLTVLDDLQLADIQILKANGRSEARMDWSFQAPWFQFELSTEDGNNDWELGGIRVAYTRQKGMIND